MKEILRKIIAKHIEKISHRLTKKAKHEILTTGKTSIRCPICNEIPEMTMTPKCKRTIITCKCGYLHDTEINS